MDGSLDFETIQVPDKERPEIKKMLAFQYSLIFGKSNWLFA